jgi:DNA repair photolyase
MCLTCSNGSSSLDCMRWDNLRIDSTAEADEGTGSPGASYRPLPLIERGAVARTFDTPGFRGMTFYEVQAKSIVSRVPDASQVPFRWTINPYRGCQHACSYCQPGETPILMADGTTMPLADVQVGDLIYGTVRDGFYRRYAITEVLAHWSTVKPGYRITLEDGTELVASGDHRFLTEGGWKHVTGAELGPEQRPFLTTNNKLMGFGGFAVGPRESADYRRGYLCGMVSGGGLNDRQGSARVRRYLAKVDGATIARSLTWPDDPSRDWHCGFLAGIFDAEGSYSGGIWRVSNTDPEMIKWTCRGLDELGFSYVIERTVRTNGLTVVRLRGGLRAAMRFFIATDPAITRKRSIEGQAVKSGARLQITAIEPLGPKLPMYDITTGTGDFIANGVVSHNCFARNSHTYLDLDSGQDFNSKVVVKVNAPELLRAKLRSRTWTGEHIAMGTNVDCYQRAEGRYELMRGIIGALRDAANPFSILTKGTLILRDLDLLLAAAEVTEVGLNVSAGFVDTDLWRAIEPGTPAPQRRLDACAALNDAGLRCGVLMGPIVPYLSDSPAQLAAAVRQAAATGAAHVSPIVLHLRPGAREWFLGWLREAHPDLVPRYAELYGRGAYARQEYRARIAGQVRELAERYRVGRSDLLNQRVERGAGAGAEAAAVPGQTAGRREQLSLF